MKIGIFDSGIGGLTVLHESYHLIDGQEYLFYADTDNIPYGRKTPEEINDFAERGISFLLDKGAEIIVVACNTATSVAIANLRKKHSGVQILGMEPAVKKAVEETDRKRILVAATIVTVREEKLKNLIQKTDSSHRVDTLALQELVKFAEEEKFDEQEVTDYLADEFSSYVPAKYSAFVLGCTHFNYFKPAFRRFFGDSVELIDGSEGTVLHLSEVSGVPLRKNDTAVKMKTSDEMLNKFRTEYYSSGRAVTDEKSLLHLLHLHNRLEEVRNV
jgi:glutamate racemase